MRMQVCTSNQWGDDMFLAMIGRIKKQSIGGMGEDMVSVSMKAAAEDPEMDADFNRAVMFSILSEAWPAGNA